MHKKLASIDEIAIATAHQQILLILKQQQAVKSKLYPFEVFIYIASVSHFCLRNNAFTRLLNCCLRQQQVKYKWWQRLHFATGALCLEEWNLEYLHFVLLYFKQLN